MLRPLFAALALAAAPAFGQSTCDAPSLVERLSDAQRADLAATSAAIPYGEGLIWTATKGATEITLAGTMHLPDDRLDPILDRLVPALDAADVILLELTPADEAEMTATLAADPSRTILADGQTLPELLDAETWSAVAEAARAQGIPPVMAARFRPWFLSLSLSMPPCAMADAARGLGGLDHRIMEIATASDTPMRALEPWDTLFTLFESTPIEDQLDLLRLGLVEPAIQAETMTAILDAYFAEDVGAVWEISRLSLDFLPPALAAEAGALAQASEAALLTGRNRNWIPVIEDAATVHDRLVVAVGAAHLPGESGVLNLLAQDGWAIRRLAAAPPG